MSNRVCRAVFVTALGVTCSLAAVQSAHAVLGGNPMTPPADASATSRTVQPSSASAAASGASGQAVMRSASSAASGAAATPSYTVRETTLGNGTVVREYLSQAGAVFAIAWSGPQMPDLADLLGSYFPQYVTALNAAHATRGGRGPAAVDEGNLVVHSGGHMGAFSGQAWLPQALPAGVSGSDIQ